jgi:Zn-dependent protease/predicted transcriptional regulator
MRLPGGVRLGQVAGIEIAVDWSLLIIFWLIFSTLALSVFPQWHPDWSAAQSWLTALAAALSFFGSVLVHELAHALVGRTRGVVIRRITLFMFGGMAQMENEPPSWHAELAMAIVGPLTSLAIGAICLWLAAAIGGPLDIDPDDLQAAFARLGWFPTLLAWLGPVNIMLGLFNLVPGFPMDGGRVLRAILWAITGDLQRATRVAARAGQGFAFLLMATGVLMVLGLRVPVLGGGLVGGLWFALIGWFLNNAAVMSYRQLVVRIALEQVAVRQIMITRLLRVDPQLRLTALVDDYLMPSGQRAFPVEQDGRLLGVVCMADLGKRPRDRWSTTPVEEIMTPAAALVTVAPAERADRALALLAQHRVNQLPVLENGVVVGMLRREDVLTWLAVHGAPAGREI